MTDRIFVKPTRADMVVRDPQTGKALLPSGGWKPRTSYWLRRLRDGAIVEASPLVTASPSKTPKE